VSLVLTLGVASASAASKQVNAYFGTDSSSGSLGGQFSDPTDIVVNSSGAGVADQGDIYVIDEGNHRIQRFALNDNGTPANPYDDTFPFVSAWGADVDATSVDGSDYEICTVAASCQAAVASAGNGSVAGNGALSFPSGMAIDQDTGNIYVSDTGFAVNNHRVNVYAGDGTFLRSFGWDVAEAGPGNTGSGFEICVAADGDVCKAGTGGAGVGQITDPYGVAISPPDGNAASGSVFVADPGNRRVSVFNLDGSIYVDPSIDERQRIWIGSSGGSFTLNFDGNTTTPIPFNASAATVQTRLEALENIDPGEVVVSGGPGDLGANSPYEVAFQGGLSGTAVPEIVVNGAQLYRVDRLTVNATGGSFQLRFNAEESQTTTEIPFDASAATVQAELEALSGLEPGQVTVTGGPGDAGATTPYIITFNGAALGGGPSNLTVFKSPLSGGVPTSGMTLTRLSFTRVVSVSSGQGTVIGSAGNFSDGRPVNVAVDSRGIVYAEDGENLSEIDRYDSQNANGDGVGLLTSIPAPPLSTENFQGKGLEVDPDSDGGGPDTDILYSVRDGGAGTTVVQQFGPINKPGLTAPPAAEDERHGDVIGFNYVGGLGFDEPSGRLFVSAQYNVGAPYPTGGEPPKSGVYVLDKAGGTATVSLESLSDVTATSVALHGKVNPNGPPDVSYRAEYSLDGTNWTTDPGTITVLGSQESPQDVITLLDPPAGLEPSTLYHVRIVVTRPFNLPAASNELTFTTAAAPPLVETTGSPLRTTTTARLEGRLNPRYSATSFHFEYGSAGPCDSNPCTSTETVAAGSGGGYRLASLEAAELQPNTTYHYRIVADNGNPGSPVYGEDMTVATRSSDAPLSHGRFSGPPGSDRAYEQVNLADTGGNPVASGVAFSDNGDRALYYTSGGNPNSPTGGFLSLFFAQREESSPHTGGWKSRSVMPPRDELVGANFRLPNGPRDLSSFAVANFIQSNPNESVWQLFPGQPAQKLFESTPPQEILWYVGADSSSRMIMAIKGGAIDPGYPAAAAVTNLYDVTDGSPELVSFLPGNVPASCGVEESVASGGFGGAGVGLNAGINPTNWLSADGDLLFFPSRGSNCSSGTDLYMRELSAEQTKPVSGSPLTGTDCGAALIKSTADAVFFWTATRLANNDTNPDDCTGNADGDVYRYEIATGARECLTCLAPGLDADVSVSGSFVVPASIAVAEDGSRIYFRSPNRLLPGTPPSGTEGSVYRLNLASGDLRWIAGPGATAGDLAVSGGGEAALSPDGSKLVFRAKDASLNPLGEGADNGGRYQYYLYDDDDRSLTCVSCPPDGSPASIDIQHGLLDGTVQPAGANVTPLAAEGTFAFSTTEALVNADQNTTGTGQDPTPGTDLYEYRDGRAVLLTDGLTNWPGTATPSLAGVSPSGRDIFFTAPIQYTQDALDGYRRLYDVRLGGGFEFPPPPKPCPLEVCQGTPKGAPEEQAPGTGTYVGPGNALPQPTARKHKKQSAKKKHKKKRQHKKAQQKQRAGHDGRNAR